MNRAKRDRDLLLWFLHAIVHMVEHQDVPAAHVILSDEFLSGNKTRGHPGTLDLLAFKKDAHEVIFHKLAFSLGVDGGDGGDWLIEGKLYHHSHEHYYGSHKGEALAWRNKLNNAQAHFIQFAEDVLYGSRYDSQIKAMLQANRSASQMDTDEGFAEALQEIKRASAGRERELESLVLVDNQTDTVDTEGLAVGSEPCSSRDGLEDLGAWTEAKFKQRLVNYMRLLHVSNGDDPLAPLLLTPAGKYMPEFDIGGHQLPRFVGIICNTSHRSGIRLPPVDVQALLNAARARHGEDYNNNLHPSDLYLTLPGGHALQNFNGWVTKLDQRSGPVRDRNALVYFKQEESMQSRLPKVHGVCHAYTYVNFFIRGRLCPVTRLPHLGASKADILPHLEDPQRTGLATWGAEEVIHGPNVLKVDDGKEAGALAAPEESPGEGAEEKADKGRTKPRNDGTVEAVLVQGMSVEFFEELIHDYSLGAVIDIGVSDGALAFACFHKKIPYTGFCLTEEHKEGVQAWLEVQCAQVVEALVVRCQGRKRPDTGSPPTSSKRPCPAEQATPPSGQEPAEKPEAEARKKVKTQAKAKGKGKAKAKGKGQAGPGKGQGGPVREDEAYADLGYVPLESEGETLFGEDDGAPQFS